MMTKRIFLFGLIVFIIQACTNRNQSVIQLRLENGPGTIITLKELRLSENPEIETQELNNHGQAKFKIGIDNPGYYQLLVDDRYTLTLVLQPGEKLSIKADLDNFHQTKKIEGSINTYRVAVLHDSLRATKKILAQLENEYALTDSLTPVDSPKLQDIERKYTAAREQHHRYTLTFILEDLRSLSNIAALYQEFADQDYVLSKPHDIQFFKLVSDTLSTYYPDVYYVQALRNNYTSIFNRYQTSKLLQHAVPIENDVPDMILPDRNGQDIALSTLKGKVVLLSFWSANQPESRTNVVQLQKVYRKYRTKGFEIYQVSIDKSLTAWEKALDFEEIPWTSVIDTAYPGSRVHMFYNVNTIPMNYLLNMDQSKIVAKNISAAKLGKVLPGLLN